MNKYRGLLPKHVNTLEGNRIIAAFAREGHLESAKELFDIMSTRDVVSWNSMLAAFSRSGAVTEARHLSEKMPAVDGFSWSSMMSTLAERGSREEIEQLFDRIPVRDLLIWTSRLHCCSRCGDLEEMLELFWKFPCWDVICWNEILTAFVREGQLSHAVAAFDEMPGRSYVTWNVLLQYFCCDSDHTAAAAIFHKLPQWSSEAWNSMIQLQEDSKVMFERMPQRDKHSWTAFLCGFSRNCAPDDALEVLQRMPKLDVVACNVVMSALASNRRVQKVAEMFHGGIPSRDVVTWNLMISAVWEKVADAAAVFDRMPQHDIVSWNSMARAHGLAGETSKVFELIHKMPCFSLAATNSFLSACAQSEQVEAARTVFDGMFHRNSVSWNTMVAAYSRSGKVAEAKLVFDAIPGDRFSKRDAVSWNALLPGYNSTGDAAVLELVEQIFQRMPCTSLVSWNTILHAYACGGHIQKAEELFQRMPDRNSLSWSGLASARLLSGRQSAASVVSLMDLDGCKPDSMSYTVALEVCGMNSDLSRGMMFHREVVAEDQHDSRVATAVVSMYSRCAALDAAVDAFNFMACKSLVSWTAMVAAVAQSGSIGLAQLVFREMQLDGFVPDSISFISILSACSHAGCVESGWGFFVSMVCEYGIEAGLDHYGCVVDLLGRAGNLEQAQELVEFMPFVPGSDTRTSFLSASRSLSSVVPGAEDVLYVGILPDN